MSVSVRRILGPLFLSGAFLLMADPASAVPVTFSCITNNSSTDCGILEAQILMDVTDEGDGTVTFHFTVNGTEPASLTDIYFSDLTPLLDDDELDIDSSGGVSFAAGCTPGGLPGGQSYGFVTSYCADSDAPTQQNGVNPGEYLDLTYALQAGATVDDVIAAMIAGEFRVGIHVQGFDGGGSESGIARVPEPTTLTIFGAGLLLLPVIGRRFLRPRR